jgi:hypothetical protein
MVCSLHIITPNFKVIYFETLALSSALNLLLFLYYRKRQRSNIRWSDKPTHFGSIQSCVAYLRFQSTKRKFGEMVSCLKRTRRNQDGGIIYNEHILYVFSAHFFIILHGDHHFHEVNTRSVLYTQNQSNFFYKHIVATALLGNHANMAQRRYIELKIGDLLLSDQKAPPIYIMNGTFMEDAPSATRQTVVCVWWRSRSFHKPRKAIIRLSLSR